MAAARIGLCSAVIAAALTLGPLAIAAEQAPFQASYAVTPVYHFDSDLDAGGQVNMGGVMASLGRMWSLDQRSSLGFRVNLDYQNWSFDDLGAFGGTAPWGNVYGVGLTLPYTLATAKGWVWNFAPMVGFAGESDASLSDSVEYGATLALVRRVSPDLTLGLGIGVFEHIEDTFVFPVVLIDWQINPQWRLSNPSQSGPAGPAGLELSYALGGGWDAGIGGTYRDERFRLDPDGPFPDGVGEHKYTVVFARITGTIADAARLGLYVGAELSPELRVDDPNGTGLYNEGGDAALLVGLSLTGQF